MSDFRVGAIGAAPAGAPAARPLGGAKGPGFAEALKGALDQVNRLQHDADKAVGDFAVGKTQDVAGTLIAVEKANLAFQFTMQIRTKLLDAYQEVLRMPV
jgi:flagellar hook-basal body complex protein FliE